MNIQPIIILGVNRNGTTLLANTLIKNFGVTALHHPLHFGFFESNLYANTIHYKDFNQLNDYLRFLGEYSSSDAFQITGFEYEDFLDHHYPNFLDFFLEMHEHLCLKEGNKHFLFKLDSGALADPRYLETMLANLKKRYKKVHFICIQRKFEAYLNSQLYMNNRTYNGLTGGLQNMLKKTTATAYYYYFYQQMHHLITQEQGLYLRYETLIDKQQETLRAIEEFLNINVEVKNIEFSRNTSFQGKNRKRVEEKAVFTQWVFSTFPRMGGIIFNIRSKKQKNSRHPILWYRLIKAKHYTERLVDEFQQKGYTNLIPLLKKK